MKTVGFCKSLSGTPATDGNNVTNAEIYRIITQQLLNGFAVWRVKMFNDRVFVEKTRRSYWLGDRYYRMERVDDLLISII
ncbi:unnamed protein product [Strongylus vulgaris]|uniref:Uncharacterized protein n=1 Tax=Strongylus vulgaris TaxID=40348 RepID=A0A3P7JPN8_STRVU|nr:unnamed protein product [Strongylus vulgaris]